MKKILMFLLLGLTVFTLGACSNEDEVKQDDPTTEEDKKDEDKDDPSTDDDKDTLAPSFDGISGGKLSEIKLLKGDTVDLLKDVKLRDNNTPSDKIELKVTDNGGFNKDVVGVYTITYTATDEAKNASTAKRDINVVDTYVTDYNGIDINGKTFPMLYNGKTADGTEIGLQGNEYGKLELGFQDYVHVMEATYFKDAYNTAAQSGAYSANSDVPFLAWTGILHIYDENGKIIYGRYNTSWSYNESSELRMIAADARDKVTNEDRSALSDIVADGVLTEVYIQEELENGTTVFNINDHVSWVLPATTGSNTAQDRPGPGGLLNGIPEILADLEAVGYTPGHVSFAPSLSLNSDGSKSANCFMFKNTYRTDYFEDGTEPKGEMNVDATKLDVKFNVHVYEKIEKPAAMATPTVAVDDAGVLTITTEDKEYLKNFEVVIKDGDTVVTTQYVALDTTLNLTTIADVTLEANKKYTIEIIAKTTDGAKASDSLAATTKYTHTPKA